MLGRSSLTKATVVAAGLAAFCPALAFPAAITDPPAGGGAPDMRRGEVLVVACPNIETIPADAVEVVLYPSRDDTSSGVGGVLVTEHTIAPGAVHVRLPDIPDLRNHFVRVQVFYLSAGAKHSCDAGRIHLL
jgi:hypothetical protein